MLRLIRRVIADRASEIFDCDDGAAAEGDRRDNTVENGACPVSGACSGAS